MNATQEQFDELTNEVRELKGRIESLERHIANLERERDMMKNDILDLERELNKK